MQHEFDSIIEEYIESPEDNRDLLLVAADWLEDHPGIDIRLSVVDAPPTLTVRADKLAASLRLVVHEGWRPERIAARIGERMMVRYNWRDGGIPLSHYHNVLRRPMPKTRSLLPRDVWLRLPIEPHLGGGFRMCSFRHFRDASAHLWAAL